tara:strand:+ start:659 stop:1096 length:438 start_codon:yes stop_codon:yes gene_type:complete
MDNSPEFLNALHYAATRAAKTGGGVEILAVITPEQQTHWLGVAETMRAEARQAIEESFKIFANWMKEELKLEAELVIREGEKATEVLNQIQEDPEVGILVLGANNSSDGPGPLINQLVSRDGGNLPIPVTIVPGSMTKERIEAVS